MSAIAYKFICADCQIEFEAPEVSEMSYGLFVMRTKESGEAAFLDAFEDGVFLECEQMVGEKYIPKKNPREEASLQQAVFATTCDVSSKGEPFEIGLMPKCPNCGSRNMKSWEPVVPTRPWPLPEVSHDRWRKKSASEKEDVVDNAIRLFRKR